MTPRQITCRSVLLLTAALLAGCSKPPQADDTPPASPVKWEPAASAVPEEWTELVGSTQPLPDRAARISAAIEGRVVSILKYPEGSGVKVLHEGDEVAENEEIAHLDDRIARLNLDKTESAVKTAGEDTAQAQTALNLASDKLTSLKALKQKTPSLVPDIDLKTAEGAEQDARSKLQAAQQRQDQARKEYEAAEAQLQLYALTAPIKGRLGRVTASLGQTLAAGAEVAEVVDLSDQIDVLCFVSQRTAARLRVGQDAGLGGLDDRPGEVRTADAPGKVAYVSDKAEPESGCFVVKVRFPNKQAQLRGNVVQRVRVLTKPGEEHLCIPESALIEDQEKPTVVIVEDVKTGKNAEGTEEQTGTARRMRAVVGVRDRVLRQVAILGLEDEDGKKWEGDLSQVLFVTQNNQGVQTGDPVRLQEVED